MFGYGNLAVVNLLSHFLSAFGKAALNYFFPFEKNIPHAHTDVF